MRVRTYSMDPLHFLTQAELIEFYHCKKTEMSCMVEPNIFLNQLRDHNLVPEDLYKKVLKMKSKERRQAVVYEILDWVEKKKNGRCVKRFWSCVFQDHILQKYPVLRILRNSLLDGSHKVYEPEEPDKTPNENESVQKKEEKVKRKKGKRSVEEAEVEDEEEPGPSNCTTPTRKKASRKPTFTSPLKKGETAEIWMWDLYKTILPVTCGDKDATLHRDKLARGFKCILHNGQWFTPNGFETFAGKGSSKNWKISIRCQKTPLQTLIKEGHLHCQRMKRRCVRKSRTILFSVSSSESSSPQSESGGEMEKSHEDQQKEREEDEEQGEIHKNEEKAVNQDQEDDDGEPVDLSEFKPAVLPVSCGSVTGEIYKKRFTGGSSSKSIRTEERWFTPEEFMKQESTLRKGYWKRDIRCHGQTLNYLLEKKLLYVHYLLCKCDCCRPVDPLAQNNDDVCFICNSEMTDGGDDRELVCCDECPRAFHQDCHLPSTHNSTNGDKWICTFCVWKCNQQIWVPMSVEEAFNSPVQQNIMRCEYLLMCLYKEDVRRVFTYDPFTTVPRYSSKISNPMWLDRVNTKLQRNMYSTVGEFVNDIRLIFQNWRTFNRDRDVGMMGARLSEIFEQKFLLSFKIQ